MSLVFCLYVSVYFLGSVKQIQNLADKLEEVSLEPDTYLVGPWAQCECGVWVPGLGVML